MCTFSPDSRKDPVRSVVPTVRPTCVYEVAHAHLIQMRRPESDNKLKSDVRRNKITF